MKSKHKIQAVVALSAMALYAFGGTLNVADAQAAPGGATKAFAVTASVLGNEVIPPTPLSENGGNPEDDQTLIGIPGDPLVVNGTLIAKTYMGPGIDSELNQSEQSVAGPYGARAIGQIEDLSVLLNEGVPGGKLVSADLVRAEAVAKCSATGTVEGYSANSEVVDLQIGGEDPFSGPLNDALKQITEGLAPLADLVSVKLNVVTQTDAGASVDAIVVTLLGAAAANGAPGALVDLVLGHAEISGDVCGDPLGRADAPECSDGVDNADSEDTLADADDPGCINNGVYDPNDDDERNECNDEVDNDGDSLADALDPGCILNGVWDPADDDERDGALARTGTSIPMGLAAGFGIGALGLLALRRRVLV